MHFTTTFAKTRLAHRTFRTLLIGLVAVLTVAPSGPPAAAASLPVVSADVKIQNMSVTSNKPTSSGSIETLIQVTVQNDNDDDAQNVQLIVTLPPTSHILSASPNAAPGLSYADPSTTWPTTGYVVFSLSTIGVGKTAVAWLKTEMLTAEVTPTTSIGAFVFGSLPDPYGTNNSRSSPVLGT